MNPARRFDGILPSPIDTRPPKRSFRNGAVQLLGRRIRQFFILGQAVDKAGGAPGIQTGQGLKDVLEASPLVRRKRGSRRDRNLIKNGAGDLLRGCLIVSRHNASQAGKYLELRKIRFVAPGRPTGKGQPEILGDSLRHELFDQRQTSRDQTRGVRFAGLARLLNRRRRSSAMTSSTCLRASAGWLSAIALATTS